MSAISTARSVSRRIRPCRLSSVTSSRPALSITVKRKGPRRAAPSRRSRVTPGWSSTSASFLPTRRFEQRRFADIRRRRWRGEHGVRTFKRQRGRWPRVTSPRIPRDFWAMRGGPAVRDCGPLYQMSAEGQQAAVGALHIECAARHRRVAGGARGHRSLADQRARSRVRTGGSDHRTRRRSAARWPARARNGQRAHPAGAACRW